MATRYYDLNQPPDITQTQPSQQDSQDFGPVHDTVSPLSQWYRDYLGRDPEAGAHADYLRRYGADENLRQSIYNSPEASAYRSRSSVAPPPTAAPPAQQSSQGPSGPNYTPPAMTPSPFILPNGMVPPGMPFSPNTGMQGLQDSILRNILTSPALSPEFVARQNEAQKELLLQRGGQQQRGIAQSAARRGTSGGAYQAGQQRRASDVLTSQLLGSQRDTANQAELANRQGFINALGASEGILGAREGRGLDTSRFAESIRQFNENLKNQQAQFGAGLDFNYNNLNASLEQQFINALLSGGY